MPVAPQVYVIVVCRINLSVVISSDYDFVARCDADFFNCYGTDKYKSIYEDIKNKLPKCYPV